jgi:hypothetical protein
LKIKGLIVIGVATVGVAAPAFAQIPVPTVQAPVPVPTVKAPVPVPTVQVPVPVPTVKAPVPVPTVQAPQTPVPQVPSVAPPSGGGGGSGGGSAGGGSAGSAGSGGGSGASGGSTSGSSGGGSSSSGPDSATSRSGSSSGGGSGSSTPRKRTSSSSPATRSAGHTAPSGGKEEPAERRERELRETVAAANSCLGELDPAQRRVITLRAGVGPGPPRSRGGVAKRLDISVRRVVRLERAGLKRLKSLTENGRCVPLEQGSGTATAGVVAAGSLSAIVTSGKSGNDTDKSKSPKGGRDGSGSGRDEGGSSTGNGGEGTGDDRGGVAGRSITSLPVAAGSGASWLIILVALVLLALAARTLVPMLLRRRRDRQLAETYMNAPQRATFVAPVATPTAEPVAEEPRTRAPNPAPPFNLPASGNESAWNAPPAAGKPEGSSQWSAAPPPPPPGAEARADVDLTEPLSARRR